MAPKLPDGNGDQQAASQTTPEQQAARDRARLGMKMITFSLWGIAVLSSITIALSFIFDATHAVDTLKYVFASILPMLGTWIGTVLAFYFSKENFEAASKSTEAASRNAFELLKSVQQEKLRGTSVETAMKRLQDVTHLSVPAGKNLSDLTIKEVDDKFAGTTLSGQPLPRLFILNDQKRFVATIHRSIWFEIKAISAPAPAAPTPTIAALLATKSNEQGFPTFGDFVRTTTAFVARDRSLADAKAAMDQVKRCQDVLVTQGGRESEEVLGWIGNTDIEQYSKV